MQYREAALGDGCRLIIYRDMNENQKSSFSYTSCLEMGKTGHSKEQFEYNRPFCGVTVFRTNTALDAKDVYDR